MTEDRFQPATVEDWQAWLVEHHGTDSGVWLVTWKKHTGWSTVSYDDAVTEALAVGWIDSLGRKLDEDRTMLYFSPRKPTSAWSRPNKIRVERLHAENRMLPAGRAAIDAAKANGAWTLLDDVENLVVPEDLAAAFAGHAGSREQWEAFPRSAKRAMLEWIVQAKRPHTRANRIEQAAAEAAEGKRAH